MNSIPLVHPRFLSMTPPALWPSLCTIQDKNESQDGQPIANPVNITGLIDIPCRLTPLGLSGEHNFERRDQAMTTSFSTHLIQLKGYYPAINTTRIAVVDGSPYDIVGVDHGGNHTFTVLRALVIS